MSFAHRPRASGGAFYDYTARYGAVREEDRITLRQNMFPEHTTNDPNHPPLYTIEEISTSSKDEITEKNKQVERQRKFEEWVSKLGLEKFLDLPFIALSNGQTRRARIVKALLDSPELLLLDEPLSECFLSYSLMIKCSNCVPELDSWTGCRYAPDAFGDASCST